MRLYREWIGGRRKGMLPLVVRVGIEIFGRRIVLRRYTPKIACEHCGYSVYAPCETKEHFERCDNSPYYF